MCTEGEIFSNVAIMSMMADNSHGRRGKAGDNSHGRRWIPNSTRLQRVPPLAESGLSCMGEWMGLYIRNGFIWLLYTFFFSQWFLEPCLAIGWQLKPAPTPVMSSHAQSRSTMPPPRQNLPLFLRDTIDHPSESDPLFW